MTAAVDPSDALIATQDLSVWFRKEQRPDSLRQRLAGALLGRNHNNKEQRRHWALRDVNLALYEGETVGIVGPNGAGKSTLCQVLAGILGPDEGSIAIRGRVTALMSIGAGFQIDLTGRKNVVLYGAYLGLSRPAIEAKVEEIVAFAELGDFIDEPIRNYSSGMRARLAFSTAAAIEPEILILDEIFAVGDAAFKQRCEAKMQDIMGQTKLIVIASHQRPLLQRLCSKFIKLEGGKVVEISGTLDP